ncbi:MAG: hypothetical protein ACREOI_24735, partial [bacterium]
MKYQKFSCWLVFGLTLWCELKIAFPQAEAWHKTNYPNTRTRILALKIDLGGHLFAASLGSGVWRSTDNGETWSDFNSGLPRKAGFILLSSIIGRAKFLPEPLT